MVNSESCLYWSFFPYDDLPYQIIKFEYFFKKPLPNYVVTHRLSFISLKNQFPNHTAQISSTISKY